LRRTCSIDEERACKEGKKYEEERNIKKEREEGV
jgi:hypothetical protein